MQRATLISLLLPLVAQTQPMLVAFGLNINPQDRIIALVFNTSMNATSCSVEALTFQNTSDVATGSSYIPTEGSCVTFNQSDLSAVAVILSEQDWQAIDAIPDLFNSMSSSFLSMAGDFIRGVNGAFNVPIPSTSAVSVSFFHIDQPPSGSSPVAVSAILNLNNGTLAVIFDQPVQFPNPTAFAIVSSGGRYGLVGALSVAMLNDSRELVLALVPDDLNNIKVQLVSSGGPPTLELQLNAVRSSNEVGNELQTVSLSVLPDTTSPQLLIFSLDMNSGRISLTFSEAMSNSTLNLSTVFITPSITPPGGGGGGYSLENGTVQSSDPFIFFNIYLPVTTLNLLKRDPSIATAVTNTFLFATPASFQDTFGNPLVPLTSAIPSSQFTADTTRPTLTSYDIDLDSGNIAMTFSEPLDPVNFSATGLSLTNSQQAQPVQLTGSTAAFDSMDTVAMLTLSDMILNEVKLLGSGNQMLGLFLTSSTASDTSSNQIVEIPISSALSQQNLIPDTTPPVLLNFAAIPKPPGNISLAFQFNEYIQVSSFNITSLNILLESTLGSQSYSQLGGGITSSSNPVTVIYEFSESERANQLFAVYYQTAYFSGNMSITFGSGLVTDLGGNAIIPPGTPLVFHSPESDPVSPQLNEFTLDIGAGRLQLTFSENILVTTPTGTITLQNSALSPSVALTLFSSSYSSLMGTTGLSITVILDPADRDFIDSADIANSIANTFLQLSTSFGVDFSGNRLLSQNPIQATAVLMPPPEVLQVIEASLDLNSGVLNISFSSSIQFSSVNLAAGLVITNGTTHITVTAASSILPANPQNVSVEITLLNSNLNEMKMSAVSLQWNVSVAPGVFLGANGAANMGQSIALDTLIADTSPPLLLKSTFDLDSGQLWLEFDEPILAASVSLSGIFLTNALTNTPQGMNLAGSSLVSAANSTLNIQLTPQIVFAIKVNSTMGTSADDTYVFLSSNSVADLYGNVLSGTGTQISAYVPDSTPPQLLSFSLDMNAGIMILNFSEPISPGTINGSSSLITPDASPNPINSSVPLLITSPSASQLNTVLSVSLADSLNELKLLLAGRTASAHLASPPGFISDASGNSMEQFFLQVATVTPDTVQPTLLDAVPNQIPPNSINNQSITFSFSEPVLLSSLDISVISIETETEGDVLTFSSFSGGVWKIDVVTASYFFSQADLSVENFATHYLKSTYIQSLTIAVEGNLATDTAGNSLVTPSSSFQHEGNGGDGSPPSLSSFVLDLNSGMLRMTFSEGVIVQGVSNMVAFQNAASNPTQTLLLFSANYTNQEGLLGSVISLTLLAQDLNSLISSSSLATSNANTFLQLSQNFAIDYEDNQLATTGEATQASEVIQPVMATSSAALPATSTVAIPVSSPTIPSTTIAVLSLSSTPSSSTTDVVFSTAATILSSSLPFSSATAVLSPSVASSFSSTTSLSSSTVAITSPATTSTIFLSTVISTTAVITTNAAATSMTTDMSSSSIPITTLIVTPTFSPLPSPFPSPSLTPTPQLSPPVLTAAGLNLNIGRLTLTFTQQISIPSVQVTSVLFTNGGNSYSITGSQGVSHVNGNNDVGISLVKTDLDAVKLLLHTSGTPWSVQLNAGAVTSVNGTDNQPQTLSLTTITPDTTAPSLQSFSIDLNVGRILLTFSEPVSDSNYNLQSVILSGNSGTAQGGYNLLGSAVSSSLFSTIFNVLLPSSTLNMIKLNSTVATAITNTFIHLGSQSFQDVSRNAISPMTTGIQASAFTSDTTSPQLSSFQLDLNSGLLSMTFSEAVDVANFDASGVRITNNAQMQGIVPTDFTLGSSAENTQVDLTLLSNLNDVKLLITSTGVQQAYISLTTSVTADTSGNAVVAISNANPLAATNVIADTTAPRLETFVPQSPSTNTILTITFNEYVSPASWSESSITLYLITPLGNFSYSDLSGGTVTSPVSSTVTYLFSSTYFQGDFAIRYQQAYFSGTIGLTFTASLVRDLSSNMVLPQMAPLVYNSNTSDPTRPQLQSFSLDLNTGTMAITFSEPVVVKDIPGSVRIQNSPSSPSFVHTLVSPAYASQQGAVGQTISLMLQQVDISGLNNNDNLANSLSDTFLSLSTDFALDYSGNSLVAQTSAVQANSVTVYTGPVEPHVLSFDLDLDSDQLSFQFDTPVEANSFNPSLVTLVNTSTISTQTQLVRLTNVTVIAQGEQQAFRILLSTADTVNIKRHPICYSAANCFAVFDQGVVTTAGNLGSAAIMTPLKVRNLLLDVTPPRFLSFPVFDLNSGLFTLIFSEPINGSSTDFTQVIFSNSVSSPTESVTLTEGFTSPDHVEIDFYLQRMDLNALKYNLGLCTSRDNCWIRLPSFFISDIGDNPFLHSNYLPNSQASYHQPTVFIRDTTPPEMESFDFDLNEGRLVLKFDEVVNQMLFSPSDITLLNAPSGEIHLQLQNDSTFTRISNGTVLELYLTASDLNWLKARSLFTSGDNSYLSFLTSLADVSGNVFINIHPSTARRVAVFTPDTTLPQLTSFNYFNIDNGTFYITFNEPVDSITTNLTKMTLVGGSSPSSPSMTLTGGMATTLNDGRREVEIYLSHNDRVAIKLIPGLAESQSNTWISMEANTIRDTSENSNPVLSSPLQLSPGGYIQDTSTATLLSVHLDLNQGLVRLNFSDVINAATISQTLLRIQNRAAGSNRSLNLTSSSQPWDTSSDLVEITLSTSDMNSLKKDLNLATSMNDTFFSLSSSFARDVENRPVVPVPSSNAQRVAVYIPDTTDPQLLSYRLDMDSGLLSFTFNEPILLDSVKPTSLIFSNSPNSPTDQHQLTGGAASPITIGAPADTQMSLQLTYTDLNIIKSKNTLAVTDSNTYLSFSMLFVMDTSGNAVIAVASMNTAAYEPDTTLPVLQYFDVDLRNGGTITMKFSEAVHFTSNLQGTVTLRSSSSAGITLSLDASEVATIASPLQDKINISLSSTHTNQLSTDTSIGSSTSNLYLSIIAGGVYDFSDGNTGLGQSIAPTILRVRHICKSISSECCIDLHSV